MNHKVLIIVAYVVLIVVCANFVIHDIEPLLPFVAGVLIAVLVGKAVINRKRRW